MNLSISFPNTVKRMGFSKSSSNSLTFKGIIINAVKLYNPRGWKNISFLWEEELVSRLHHR